ncbi:MAG: hypothetical protein FWE94_08090, partial [Coriobacteriia bacterium]|nr:hypothetical protein [Coriobacteriia bacterium]
DGTLWAWGYNGSGQLGNGSTVDAETPVRAGDAADKWQAVSAGMNHSLAIRRDGSLWAWGYNNFGQLGIGMIGSSTSTDTPVPARGATGGWKAVSAGDVHSLGIRSDGSLWAWGGNGDGRLGIGSTVSTGTPAPIGSAADKWQAVGAGGGHSLGIKRNGTLWAWGLNSNGQLGIGTSGPLSSTGTPILVGSAADGWKTISVGYRHSLGVKGDGSLWAWGLNSNGQLGDGTGGSRTDANNRSAPVLIGGPLLGTTSGARP